MDHNNSQLFPSNRTASRRLHRRPATSSNSSCTHLSSQSFSVPTAMLSLPRTMVHEAGMLELLAAELRIAELEQALTEARAVACSDPLTGALNRRGFEKAWQSEQARARRNGSTLALAHIDVDDFKRLNDSFGHQAGDQALVHLVSLLQKSMRPSDVLARFGGEEFVLLLPDTGLEAAAEAVGRFLSEVSGQAVPGSGCVMSFSAGVVTQSSDESLDAALQRADAATYAAKRAGKKRIVTG